MTQLIFMVVSVDPKAEAIAALRASILDAPGVTDRSTRELILAGDVADERYAAYVAKVRESSYKVTPSDFAAMTAAGLTEDAIFEITVASALGAATRRLDAALQAMKDEG